MGNPTIPSGVLQMRCGHSEADISGSFSIISESLRLDPKERAHPLRLLQSNPWLLSLGAPNF